jgi:hypothetical protein
VSSGAEKPASLPRLFPGPKAFALAVVFAVAVALLFVIPEGDLLSQLQFPLQLQL